MKDSTNLDVLRAIAVSLVLGAHVIEAAFGPHQLAAAIGRAGVLFFFVHTCTVLMHSLERDPSAKNFYIRRFFRIYPLSIAAVLLVVVGRFPFANWPKEPFHVTTHQVIANLLLVQNLFNVESVIRVLWSLPLEVQMYVFLPFLFAFHRVRIEWLWLGSVVVALVLNHWSVGGMNVLLYAPCFLPGVMAYRQSKYVRKSIPAWLFPVLVIAIAPAIRIPKAYVQWLACFVLGLAIPRFTEFRSARLAHTIAKYSYGIYLSHAFAIYLAFTTFSHVSLPAKLAIIAACVPLFAAFCFHAIESPFIKFGKSLSKRRKEELWAMQVGSGR